MPFVPEIEIDDVIVPLTNDPTDHGSNNIVKQQLANPRSDKNFKFPTRYGIVIVMFLSMVFAYVVRATFSISLLAMVNQYDANGTLIPKPDYGERYDWSEYDQGLLLGAFYYAYTVASLPLGILVDRFNIGRLLVGGTFLLAAVLTVLSPLAASSGTFIWLFVVRLAIGATQGTVFMNLQRLITRWSPRSELGLFTCSVFGNSVGTVLAWVIAGVLIENCGWQWSFYVVGILAMVFACVWFVTAYDSPALHPRIPEAERRFIEDNLPLCTDKSVWPPVTKIIYNLPFWALVCINFSTHWGLYFAMTGVPKFLNQALGFNVANSSFLSALPYVARFCGGVFFGFLGDYIRSRNLVSLLTFRKCFCLISHVAPGLFLLGIPFVQEAEQSYICIILLVLSMLSGGANSQVALGNVHDIAPTMAASILALTNTLSSSSGFISPLVVAYFTNEKSTIAEWRYVFAIGAGVQFIGAAAFIVFGSSDDQKWHKTRPQKLPKFQEDE